MKCVFGVIYNKGEAYDTMRQVWIENVSNFNKTNTQDIVELYFIEGVQRSDTQLYSIDSVTDNIFSFKANCQETFVNILTKSIIFYKHVSNFAVKDTNDDFTFVIRSNLSTLFHLNNLFKYLKESNKALASEGLNNYLGGSIIDKYCQFKTFFSGTNLTMTIPSVRYIVKNYKDIIKYKDKEGDDVLLSTMLVNYYWKDLLLRDIMRLDFTPEIIFNSCKSFNKSVFCFRFKTDDRMFDADLMTNISKQIYKNEFSTEQTVYDLLGHDPPYFSDRNIYVRNEEYEKSFTKPFRMKAYMFRDVQVIYPEFI